MQESTNYNQAFFTHSTMREEYSTVISQFQHSDQLKLSMETYIIDKILSEFKMTKRLGMFVKWLNMIA